MIRLLIRTAIHLVTAALAILVAALILPDFQVSVEGFVIAVVVFAIAQGILTPFIINVARKYASALLGGIGLVSSFVALLIATFFPGGIVVNGIITWVLATLILWIITALGGWILPLIFLKQKKAANS